MEMNSDFWKSKYIKNTIGWDTGKPAPPLVSFFETITDKSLKILIPGCGNAYEAEYLHTNGFTNVYVMDYVQEPLDNLLLRCPSFPKENLICENFFEHKGDYDLIIELAFFTAIEPKLRSKFAKKMFDLLAENGRYSGLFFNKEFGNPHPPFGAYPKEYKSLFEPYFSFEIFVEPDNSIVPRAGQEIFFELLKK